MSNSEKCPVEHNSNDKCPVEQKNTSRQEITETTERIVATPTTTTTPRSLEREHSSILKPDGSEWEYPSEEQFYQAMKRKGKKGVEQVSSIVKIHNTVNEKVWKEILKWEHFKDPSTICPPRLASFLGRPTSYTPKARLYQLFGYKLPFDRHDWVVKRCEKETVYVIDFYSATGLGFYLDVRPKMTLEGAWDRLRYWWSGQK